MNNGLTIVKRGKGRPPKNKVATAQVEFDPKSIQIFKGSELKFNDSVFTPMRTGTLMDDVLSVKKGPERAFFVWPCGNLMLYLAHN